MLDGQKQTPVRLIHWINCVFKRILNIWWYRHVSIRKVQSSVTSITVSVEGIWCCLAAWQEWMCQLIPEFLQQFL